MEDEKLKEFDNKLKMLKEENRLETFKKWPFSDKEICSPAQMAKAGFYCIGDDDLVTCFICSKQLDGWVSEDDPWEEHRIHSLSCLFAKLGKATKDLTNPQILELKEEQVKLCLTQHVKLIQDSNSIKYAEMKKVCKKYLKK